ncbi:hypothetical protein Tco_0835763 [Tanacetum coccineum]
MDRKERHCFQASLHLLTEVAYEIFKQQYRVIPSKKSKGKGSQRKKTTDTTEETIDVSKESNLEPTRKRTASRRVVKKKVIISADDNIIPELNIALELGKSMSLNEVAEEEATRQVHATHARIVTKTVLKPTRRRHSGIAFRDTSSVTKKMSLDPSKKVKGVQTLTLKEQLAADIMKALKESMKTTKRQPVKELVLSQGFPMRKRLLLKQMLYLSEDLNKKSKYSKDDHGDDEEVDWIYSDEDDEKNDDDDDEKSIDLEMTADEEFENEFVQVDE